eukprot:gene3511-8305_t
MSQQDSFQLAASLSNSNCIGGDEESLLGVGLDVILSDIPSTKNSRFKSFLLDELQHQYTQAMSHLGKTLDEERPYDHLYACRNDLQNILIQLKDMHSTFSDVEERTCEILVTAFLMIVVLEASITRTKMFLGTLHIDTDEPSEGCKFLSEVRESPQNNYTSGTILYALNREAIVWANRKEHIKALDILQQGMGLYDIIKEKEIIPWGKYEMLPTLSQEQRMKEFESSYTHTLFYVAQCYMNLEQASKAAEYCQQTLSRQFNTGEYDCLDWAVNAAAIAQYLISENAFEDARLYLACAQTVSTQALSTQKGHKITDDDNDNDEDIQQKHAALAQCWVKYYLALLNVSWQLMQGSITKDDITPSIEPPVRLNIPGMEKHLNQAPAHFITTADEARVCFSEGQRWIKAAMCYYTLEDHASGHVICVQDNSQLYKQLAAFEELSSVDNACKMHKRRVDMLDHVLNELNPQYYLAICKQLAFELGGVYQDMMDLKLSIFKPDQAKSMSQALKINKLGRKAIASFQRFIDFHRDQKRELPQRYEDGVAKGIMTAHFTIARIYSKLIPSNRSERVNLLQQSLKWHKYIVDYCEANPDFTDFQRELELSSEMVQLLPAQIQRL